METNIIRQIKMINNTLEADRNKSLKAKGLTGVQVDFLAYIKSREGQSTTQKDLCQYFGSKHTSVINVLTRLEEKDFVERRVDEANPKSRQILLTPKAEQVLEGGIKIRKVINEVVFDGIQEEEKILLTQLLDRMYDNLSMLEKKKEEEFSAK